MSATKSYRSTMMIIHLILEELMKHDKDGLIKYKLFKNLSLRTSIGEKYLSRLEQAGYLTIGQEYVGKKFRYRIMITPLGIERFEWFIRITTELRF
jgi:predicted transcriptional regulator